MLMIKCMDMEFLNGLMEDVIKEIEKMESSMEWENILIRKAGPRKLNGRKASLSKNRKFERNDPFFLTIYCQITWYEN